MDSTKLYTLQETSGKGLGLVAAVKIPKGRRILSEAPLLLVPRSSHTNSKGKVGKLLSRKVATLGDEKRRVFFSLHNAFEDEATPELGIVRTNALPLGSDASQRGIFVEASRINHACVQNAQNTWNEDLGQITIHAIRDINEGEEITIMYLRYRLNRATRQRTLQQNFRFSCSCTLCSLPPSQRGHSDARLDEIQRLDEAIGNAMTMISRPLQALHDVHRLLQLCEEEGLVDGSIPRAYYDAFQIAIFNGDRARASVFAERATASREILEGDDSPTVRRHRALAKDPTGHRSYGSSRQWSTSTSETPSGLSMEAFDTWLWREQKIKETQVRRRYADLRDDSTFPSFHGLPDENELDLEFFESNDGFSYHPRKHWCFLAEIVEIEKFLRLRLVVEDKAGQKTIVAFYTGGRGIELDPSRVREGFTIAVLYPHQHRFLDTSVGIRHEDAPSLKIFPVALKDLLSLSDKLQKSRRLELRLGLGRCPASDMALLNPTFLLAVIVLFYISTFVLFAILRILTGISIQRIGYLSLRRLAYTPRDGLKLEIRGLGINLHRPTFAQPTWISIIISELVATVDAKELGSRSKVAVQDTEAAESPSENENENENDDEHDAPTDGSGPQSPLPTIRRTGTSKPTPPRTHAWRKLSDLKDKIKRLQRNVNWLRMFDIVATNSTINVVGVASVQVGSLALGVDTRRKMVDRARFFFAARAARKKQDQQAEWVVTLKSILFTAEGREPLEVLDNATLNVDAYLSENLTRLRDACVALKLGRVHVPCDDVALAMDLYRLRRKQQPPRKVEAESSMGSFMDSMFPDFDGVENPDNDLMQTIADSKEFVTSLVRGIKEVQFAVSFVGLSKKVHSAHAGNTPLQLTASMKEVGIDLHRLDPKSPVHQMYFPLQDVAHEALVAALSISIGLDDGQGKPERLLYIPMATTTVRTTLPSKTVKLTKDGGPEERNANILFANSVVTSPSIDLDPRHLPLLISLLRPKPRYRRPREPRSPKHHVISRLLPKATLKFSMHEPVIRIALPAIEKDAESDDFDLIISSISSVSLDMESFHSAMGEMHYSLTGTTRVQSHNLYYQTSSGRRFDLMQTDAFDLKVQVSAAPELCVVANGNLQSFAIKLVRPEITNGLHQIIKHLRLDEESNKLSERRRSAERNFLRSMPPWLLHIHLQIFDFSFEVAGADEHISDEHRGVSLQLSSLVVEYRAQRLEGLPRRRSRRRTSNRSLTPTPSIDFSNTPSSSPSRKTQQNHGDERRLSFNVKGLEAYIVEAADKMELEPFLRMPRFDLALSAHSDSQGPLFQLHANFRSILVQYSLYRHYAVGLATVVLRKAFTGSAQAASAPKKKAPSVQGLVEHLAPPGSPLNPARRGSSVPELFTVDIKVALIQVKGDMPNDPPLMLQVHGVDAGRHRWSPPFFASKLTRLYVGAPRMRGVWARVVSIKSWRVDYRRSRHKLASGTYVEEKMFDIVSEAARLAVPHETIVHHITDNIINVVKSVQQLHHRFRTGKNEYILDKGPEGPKNVPKVSLRTRNLLFELEDGAFEWKLGMIYRAGRIEQVQRLAREEAFRMKMKRIHEEESRRESSKLRSRSTYQTIKGTNQPASVSNRSRSADGRLNKRGRTDDRPDRRAPRYDPEGDIPHITSYTRLAEEEAREKLHIYNSQSWRKRITRAYATSSKGVRDMRSLFWGADHIPEDFADDENILEVPERPALLSALISDFQIVIDKPSFPLSELPDFLHSVGKGMPRDMQYGLLVPMHVQIDMNEARACLRDYPLPFIHVPALKSGQSSRLHSLSMKTDFVIAEEYRGADAARKIRVQIVPPGPGGPGSRNDLGFAIDVRRTIGPVKSYSNISVDINTALPTRITWGPSYQPAMQDMMMAIESFTKPQLDPSERVGFWDKLRLVFHSRINVAWKGDGDVHLALKGTRDPYLMTKNGAGFLMCWRNDVRLALNSEDDPKRLVLVDSGEYVLAVPDYSHEVREEAARGGDISLPANEEMKAGASFKKVVMKLSGDVQWMIGLMFEQPIDNGRRSFAFRPHYDIVLKSPLHAKSENNLPYDALRGFRSQHIHLSIGIRAPVTRDWTSSDPAPSKSYNTAHFSPRFFTHFFNWWGLFGSPLSLPIRQGRLFPGREVNSKKFGRHLATVKYNLLLAPLFLSHIYKHKNLEATSSENGVSATGIKVRFDSFMLDLHQRREEFSTRDSGRKAKSRTSGIKIHAAQLDLVSADVRAVSATMESMLDSIRTSGLSALALDQSDDTPDHSRFTIPDNDHSWIDMDDFVELDWASPSERNPDVMILPLAYAPRLTYFRQTDIGGIISGDPDRTSPFGGEPTHPCILSHDDDPKRVQAHLIKERLSQLEDQMEAHADSVGEAEFRVMQDGGGDAQLLQDFETLRHHTGVLCRKRMFLEHMLQQMTGDLPSSPSSPVSRSSSITSEIGNTHSDTSLELAGRSMSLPSGAEFDSDFTNRFVVHNMQLKWNNLLRNIVIRYFNQSSQRRGFVYYLSRPAIKFILDIVEEQAKTKSNSNGNGSTPRTTKTPASSESGSTSTNLRKDIEDRIRSILGDGKDFVDAEEKTSAAIGTALADLASGIAAEFTPQNNYHVRLIAPQIQLQSDKNKKHVVLITAKGMDLKVVEVMDKARISDSVSGLVQRRILLSMDSAQFFVTHQKWFQTQIVSMYAGSRYGAPLGSAWPPWVPVEVIFDFQADPFGFKRVVQETSATLRYDKYNNLRLKYHDEVNTDGPNADAAEATESRMDNLWVEFPQARALCNSSQYYAMYVIVLDLLMYSEPSEKTRSERLEKIMLASDFSDLSGAPERIQKLQERVRQLENIKSHLAIYGGASEKQGWDDLVVLERDLEACEDELFFLMKAITTSQGKHEPNFEANRSNALLKWTISAKDIVWHLIKDSMEPLVELQLRDVEYDRTDMADGSHINVVRVGKIIGLNLLPHATYPDIIAPYVDGERGTFKDVGDREMLRVCWHMLEDIAGIPVMDHFEVNLFPMKIQLEHEVGKQLFEYIFPHVDGAAQDTDNSPLVVHVRTPSENDDDDETSAANSSQALLSIKGESSFNTRPGSLELRLQPTLTSHTKSNGNQAPKKALSVHTGDGHSFRLFRSPGTSRVLHKKASRESLKHGNALRPGIIRAATAASTKDGASYMTGDSKKVSRFVLRNKAPSEEKQEEASDDLTRMIERASNYMSFAYIRMASVELCLSYKGKESRNLEDVHDFVFRMPQIEWRNKTWSNLDLALALKKAVIKALISHTGAIIGNKFSKHKPNTAQQSRLRELASSSVIIGGQQQQLRSAAGSPCGDSVNSDDSSSNYGGVPMDFSRSPPRSLRSMTQESLQGPRSASRSSSVASTQSARTGNSASMGLAVPSFLMMTPPTPDSELAPHAEERPVSRRSLNRFGGSTTSSSTPNLLGGERSRKGYIKGKLNAMLGRENTIRGGRPESRSGELDEGSEVASSRSSVTSGLQD
ncbi:related to FMP27 Found in Mitochondrial Proteome [Cephalotrichum gorgonifer]|uniref:Related to FMP27 Found in Mitochondrial Proteome n=1 Tax=Cephalotrichum gorgonifer TaxID=2041049 RepID=A0AAE8N1A8_9PEZI|nr:related to FMP27 Found in Mitochondrial Proteome [Cephalotrichum gorgonifer]